MTTIGPRLDAPDVPILRPGRDRLPTHCGGCGSRLLSTKPPLGQARFGTLDCTMCGKVLCFLGPPWTRIAPPSTPVTPARPAVQSAAPIAWRLPGCGPACVRLDGGRVAHQAAPHEEFGRREALAEIAAQAARPKGLVRTGPLVVDFDHGTYFVAGVELYATPGSSLREPAVLRYLAGRVGQRCDVADIVRTVWGAAEAEQWSHAHRGYLRWQGLRVVVAKLRRRLTVAGPLIQTMGNAYRLRVVPVEVP